MAKQGKNNRKVGRNKDTCAAYKAARTASKNKIKRMVRRLRTHPNDKSALQAWKHHHTLLGKTAPDLKTGLARAA